MKAIESKGISKFEGVKSNRKYVRSVGMFNHKLSRQW